MINAVIGKRVKGVVSSIVNPNVLFGVLWALFDGSKNIPNDVLSA